MTFWDIIAPVYDIFELSKKGQIAEKICELTPQGANVLELASGTGDIALAVSKKAGRVLCTDISENMLKTAKRKVKKHGVNNISFDKISIFETGRHDNSFDVVIASQILHLLNDPEIACKEIRRVAKNAVFLVIPMLKEATPFRNILIRFYKLFGFDPKRKLDRNSCKVFLEEMGFVNCEYYIIKSATSSCIAVWKKN